MLPSQRDTTPDIPARDVFLQFAQRPMLAVCGSPVRTCRALMKNRRALSRSGILCPFVEHAMKNSSRENGVSPIALISSPPFSRNTEEVRYFAVNVVVGLNR